jgi:hypothetical protein
MASQRKFQEKQREKHGVKNRFSLFLPQVKKESIGLKVRPRYSILSSTN